MSLHLITGYAGESHITSADQGAYNMATYGEGQFVLNRGNKFVTTIVSNNSVTVADGEAMMQGRYIKMIPGTSESVTIDNGTAGMKRHDLICLRYEKDSGTGVETATMVVKKGTEDASTPVDPTYVQGDITDGTDLVNEMPLYRVLIDGLTLDSITPLFTVKTSMVDYMDSYQLPIAGADTLGGVKIGSGISVASDGKISAQQYTLPTASSSTKGGVKIPSNTPLYISSESLYIQRATTTQLGVMKIGSGLWEYGQGEVGVKIYKTSFYAKLTSDVVINSLSEESGTIRCTDSNFINHYNKDQVCSVYIVPYSGRRDVITYIDYIHTSSGNLDFECYFANASNETRRLASNLSFEIHYYYLAG